MSEPKLGFEMPKVRLALDDILPVRQIKDSPKEAGRYSAIVSSIPWSGWSSRSWFIPRAEVGNTCFWTVTCATMR